MDEKTNKTDNDEPQQSWLEKIAATILMPHTPSDFLSLVNLAVKKGTIDSESRDMIKGVIKVASSQVDDIMIPRTQMATIHTEMDAKELIKTVINSSHTRLPVFTDNREDVLGILHAKDLLKLVYENKSISIDNLTPVLRPAIFVPESKKLDALLRDFKSSHNHLAIVVDEYGVISGLITIEDILEEIVGDIEDEFDEEETQINKISDTVYQVDAFTEIETFNAYFNTSFNDEEADTIGGLIINHLERLPKKGETIKYHAFIFEVTAADQRRIHQFKVTTKPNEH